MVNNIGNWQHDKWSVHTASTIGSLTHRHFWRWKKCNRSSRGKIIDEELQGQSKVENRLRMEGRRIEKD